MDFALCIRHAYLGLSSTCSDTLEATCVWTKHLRPFFLLHLIYVSVWTREESKKAVDCLRTALRDYNLKFGTILNDPDLAPFRASSEFKELQEEVCGFLLNRFATC
jgi:hypothetical protein